MQSHILLIGDLSSAASALTKLAKSKGMAVTLAADAAQGIEVLCQQRIEMAFVSASLNLPDFFSHYNEARLNTPVVTVGDASNVQNAVSAIRLGAIEYLTTPLDDKAVQELLSKVGGTTSGPIAADAKTQKLLELGKKFAASSATVLLRGESGTGKEVFSRFIHDHSPRKNGPFVSVNCAAIPENLLESELFGHEKGAFSGALTKRIGKFQQADGGTLLLDEISEMDIALQSKLLRAIQERIIDPVGAAHPVPVDIRLVATTNRDLEKEVEKGTFREDLYFRLSVITLELPPLRERPGDVLSLAQHFAQKFGEQYDMKNIVITPAAQEKLTSSYWKGNVRELENTIHRAVLLMTDNKLDAEHIEISSMSRAMAGATTAAPAVLDEPTTATAPAAPVPLQRAPQQGIANAYAAAQGGYASGAPIAKNVAGGFVGRSMEDMERELILGTLDYCGGNRTHAADILGISIRTLRNKLKEYEDQGLPVPETAGTPAHKTAAEK